jgi:hypothetical protein
MGDLSSMVGTISSAFTDSTILGNFVSNHDVRFFLATIHASHPALTDGLVIPPVPTRAFVDPG